MLTNKLTTLTLGLLLALVTATGCIAPDEGAQAAITGLSIWTAEDEEATANHDEVMAEDSELLLEACDEHFAIFTTPESQADPYLPEGFELVAAGGEPLPEGVASLVLLTLDCQVTDTGEHFTQVWVHLPVDPPEAYTREDAAFHYVPVYWPVSASSFIDTMQAWGIPQPTAANLQLDAGSSDPGLATWQTRISQEGATATFTTETVGNHPEAGGGVARIFGVTDGEVTGIVDFQGTTWEGAAGIATFQDDGLIPLDVQGPGPGGLALDYSYVVTPADLPGGT